MRGHIPMGVPLQTEMTLYGDLKNITARRLNLIKPALSLRSAFAGCDVTHLIQPTERCNLLNLHDHVGRIRRLRRIRQSTAGGHKPISTYSPPANAHA